MFEEIIVSKYIFECFENQNKQIGRGETNANYNMR